MHFLKTLLIALLAGGLFLLAPSTASAQFGFNGPVLAPPIGGPPRLYYQHSFGVPFMGPYGPTQFGLFMNGRSGPPSLGFSSGTYGGYAGPWMPKSPGNSYSQSYGGTISGSVLAGRGYDPNTRNFLRAQNEAARPRSQDVISGERAYEQGIAPPQNSAPGVGAFDPLPQALAPGQESEIASGEALNHILTAIAALEAKKPKSTPSAFLSPAFLDEVRLGGTPTSEALQLLRSAGHLPFPTAFELPALRESRDRVEQDLAGAANPLLLGKPIETNRLSKLETTVKKAQQTLTPLLRELPFDDAAAARRFLNRVEATIKVLREPASAGLLNPRWPSEGTDIAGLASHMAKYKVQFAPAAKGGEGAYLTLHRGLAGYLFALNQTVAKK